MEIEEGTNSLISIVEFLKRQEESALNRTTEVQWDLADGNEHWYFSQQAGLGIVGRIAPIEETLQIESQYYTDSVDDQAELAEISHTIRERLKRGYVHVRAYSVIEKTGELGSEHISNMVPISEELFNEFRNRYANS